MGESSALLERLGSMQIFQSFVYLSALLFGGLNTLSLPVDKLGAMIVESSKVVLPFKWVFDLAIAFGAVVYVFLTEATDIPKGEFALTELSARSVLFLSGISLALLTTSAVVAYFTQQRGGSSLFSDKYDRYLATFRHGIHSMLVVAVAMLWRQHDDRNIKWTGTDETEGTWTFLLVLFIVLMVNKFLSEVQHGEDARLSAIKRETIGDAVELKPGYKFKHARGAALTVATGLLLYMLTNADMKEGFWTFVSSKMVALTLSIYIIVVSLERIAGGREWVIGGAGGLVVTGIVSFLNLIAAGLALAEDQTDVAVVVTLGVILLDGMRVGYGQLSSDIAFVGDRAKVSLRLLQALAGLVCFLLITRPDADHHSPFTTLLTGVALASALVKIVSITYIGKDLLKSSTEHHYRELASTGLLLSSAFLWSHPLSDDLKIGVSVSFFVIAILCRFLDSVLDFLMSGKQAIKYIAWDKDEDDSAVASPTSDNPRTWLTLLSLIVSLVFASMVMHAKIDDIELGEDKPLDKELSNSMIVAVTFIGVHVAVVLAAIVEDVFKPAALVALSRSKFVRFVVTTTVLSSLSVAAGAIGFGGVGHLSSDSPQGEIVSALLAYLFADVVGRELL